MSPDFVGIAAYNCVLALQTAETSASPCQPRGLLLPFDGRVLLNEVPVAVVAAELLGPCPGAEARTSSLQVSPDLISHVDVSSPTTVRISNTI